MPVNFEMGSQIKEWRLDLLAERTAAAMIKASGKSDQVKACMVRSCDEKARFWVQRFLAVYVAVANTFATCRRLIPAAMHREF